MAVAGNIDQFGPYVLGKGPRNSSSIFVVGEAPGETEYRRGEPFVGKAGHEQDMYLSRHGYHSSQMYKTNVVKTYIDGNPDPTKALIEHWTPVLEDELVQRRPKYVLAVGRFAMRWFLGNDLDMDMTHGIPHRSTRPGCEDALILPCFHPAFGFYDDDARVLISYDYERACAVLDGKKLDMPTDTVSTPTYTDVSGADLAQYLATWRNGEDIAIDTEGIPTAAWSIQVSLAEGSGYILRCARRDFSVGIAAIRTYVLSAHRPLVILHNLMYDLEMCRVMGLPELAHPGVRLFDTRYAAYILRREPQGLKALGYRWCGVRMASYDETVGPSGIDKQLAYLGEVLTNEHLWPKPEPRIEHSNDGTSRVYTPQPITKRVVAILSDFYNDKRDKDGNPTDLAKRWHQVDQQLRRQVETVLGPLPIGTLDDIGLSAAVSYACRDSDVTLRLKRKLVPALKAQGLTSLMADGMATLPVFEEMQFNGMAADIDYCRSMSDAMWARMCSIGARISNRYFQGRPFNPGSSDQVATLMRRRGLVGEKRSRKTGKVSTAKKSIEHLRYTDDAMADVIEWREHQKMRDAFYEPMIERLEEQLLLDDSRAGRIRTHINPYKVTSRRISSSNPNLTAIPVRNDLGVQVRDGFIAEDGCMFGSWDLSQIEMRYMAHESRDPLLVKFFSERNPVTGKDFDIHAETASRIFGIKLEDVQEKQHRYPAKRAGFGIITNIQGAGLLDQLRMFGCQGWTEDSCDDLIEEWLKVYGGVKRYLDACKQEVRRTGRIVDMWGMPRYLPGVWSDDRKTVAEAERAASSMKIQGGAQGMIQHSMAWLRPYIYALSQTGTVARWILQIHDEVILEADEALMESLDVLVKEALTEHSGVKLIVPVKASGTWAKSWGKLK